MTVQTVHRQFGSKVRVAHQLLQLVPGDVRVWVEGFAGTAAVTLSKAPHPAEHLNDLNGDIVNLFDVLRDEAARLRLCEQLELTPYAQEEHERCMTHVLAVPADDDPDPVERARRFLVTSWQGIAGKQGSRSGWRLERKAGWLPGTWGRLPLKVQAAGQRLRLCQIHRRHVLELVELFADDPGALLFLDPPYPRHSIDSFGSNYAVDMTDAEHQALAQRLTSVKCRILLTMSEGTVYSEVLKGWHVTPYVVRGLKNSKKLELALTNYPPPVADLFNHRGG